MNKRVELPRAVYDGYIFDLDGTLVDSMPTHLVAWNRALADVGMPPFIEAEYYSWGGRSAVDIVEELAAREGRVDIEPQKVAVLKRRYYMSLLEECPALPIEEVVAFVRAQRGRVPMAIATGSALEGAEKTLAGAGLAGFFDIIVTPADVKEGKPAPDMFLLAAARMGVAASSCCVFEDALPGIVAAKAAGMDVVIVGR